MVAGLHTRAGAPAWRLDMTSVSLVRAGLTLAHCSAEQAQGPYDPPCGRCKSEAQECGLHKVLQQLSPRVKRTFYQNVSSPAAFFWPLYSVRNGNFQLSAPTMCLASSFCECVCPVAVGKGLCCVHCPRGSHCLWAPALPGSLVPPDRMPEPHLRSELCTSPSVALLGSHSPGTISGQLEIES
nr:uncharacterized protein LOC105472009 isoform X2 [Macaca nemestrina]